MKLKFQKVTIYIAAYNAEKTILSCVNSIINQTIKFDEILIIDDKSTDNTVKLLENFQNIKLLKNPHNKGLSYCRNLAFKNSTNDIVASIDSDVVLENNWLEIMLGLIDKNDTALYGGKMIEKFTQNKFNSWRAKYYSQNWGQEDMDNPPFIFGCNSIQKKDIWNKVKGYDESFLTNGEDIDYSNKVKSIKQFKLFYSSNAVCHHLQQDNLSSLSNRVWRYHSYGYKLKKISLLRFIKLCIKQIKFFFNRTINDLFNFRFNYIYINFWVLIRFINLEYRNYLDNK